MLSVDNDVEECSAAAVSLGAQAAAACSKNESRPSKNRAAPGSARTIAL